MINLEDRVTLLEKMHIAEGSYGYKHNDDRITHSASSIEVDGENWTVDDIRDICKRRDQDHEALESLSERVRGYRTGWSSVPTLVIRTIDALDHLKKYADNLEVELGKVILTHVEDARRDDDEPGVSGKPVEPERCPIVKTAYGELPVGTRYVATEGKITWTLGNKFWTTPNSVGKWDLSYNFRSRGEILQPLAHDALGHPIYEGDRVKWKWYDEDERLEGVVMGVDGRLAIVAREGENAILVFMHRLRKVHSPEPIKDHS